MAAGGIQEPGAIQNGDRRLQRQSGIDEWLAANWAQPPETFRVEVEGASIACRGWNLAADDLPGMVLVHGLGAHGRWWDHLAPTLAAGHRVVALDLSGMGDSDRRREYSLAMSAREVLGVAAHCGFDPVTIIAHSFGTMGSMIAARRFPEKVRHLIVIDSAFTASDEPSEMAATPQRFYDTPEAAISRFRLIPPGKWPQPAVLAYIARNSVCETAKGWTWKFDTQAAAPVDRGTCRELMMGVPVPIDLVYGDRTEVMTAERRAALRDVAPNVRREVVIPACHHHVLIERPLALVAVLEALLAG